jgi:protein-tyrosine phosphatase
MKRVLGFLVVLFVAVVSSCSTSAGIHNDDVGAIPKAPVTVNDDVFAAKKAIPIDGVVNVRDLGGYKTTDGKRVKTGLLYRSGSLSKITPEGLAEFEKLNIEYVFDMRSKRERTSDPEPEIANATSVAIEMPTGIGGFSWKDENDFYANYAATNLITLSDFVFVSSQARAALRDIILTTNKTEGKRAIDFHCSAGKDRTGYVAAIMLKILHVDNDTVLKDYLLSNETRKDTIAAEAKEWDEKWFHGDKELMKNFYIFHYVRPEYAGYIYNIDRLYGNVDTFLTMEAGLSQEDLDTFRALYTETL